MRNFLGIIPLLIFFSCSKTPVLEASEAMVGSWIHFNSKTDAHRIVIHEDGSGKIEWIVDDNIQKGTKIRDWYLEDNILYFGKAAFNGETYEIDKYPTMAWDEIIKYYDTIPELTRYIVLEGKYYAEEE